MQAAAAGRARARTPSRASVTGRSRPAVLVPGQAGERSRRRRRGSAPRCARRRADRGPAAPTSILTSRSSAQNGARDEPHHPHRVNARGSGAIGPHGLGSPGGHRRSSQAQDEVAELLSRPDPHRHDQHRRHGHRARGSGPRPSGWPASSPRSASTRRSIESEPGPAPAWSPASPAPTAAARPLLVHGHLDVVPADPAEWSVHPFSGEERDGYVWGRGAVDMKDMDAMVLALVRDWARTGVQPPRDIVLAFVADEEAGGRLGRALPGRQAPRPVRRLHRGDQRGRRLQHHRPRRPAPLPRSRPPRRASPGCGCTAGGRPGHGSMVHDDNAVTRLCRGRRPHRRGTAARSCSPPPMRAVPRRRSSDAYGIEIDPDEPEQALARLGAHQPG